MEPDPIPSLSGRLVVAAHVMSDPNFAQTVVLLIEHNDEGALGVVLNRPTMLPVEEALPEWAALATDPPVLFSGGPVQAEQGVLGLGRPALPPAEAEMLLPGVAVVNLDGTPEDSGLDAVRLYAGYAGWGPKQLELELEVGAWYIVDGVPEDVFTLEPESLWLTVLRRRGGLFRTVPEDPSTN